MYVQQCHSRNVRQYESYVRQYESYARQYVSVYVCVCLCVWMLAVYLLPMLTGVNSNQTLYKINPF